tara:strand:+ start:500 stop:1708 length:1209 start_codon:yes stop_codon:yes gene_type:complete
MIKNSIFLLITLTIVSIFRVNAQDDNLKDWVESGKVENKSYYTEIPFRYIDGYIFIEITQNEKKYNFLYDTGAEATVIDKSIINEFSFQRSSQVTIGGPIVETEDLQKLVISEINIADITYSNIGAVSTNLAFSNIKFCDKLHGIIGSNLIKKSKWQLDYDKELIKISNDLTSFNIGTPKFVLDTKLPPKGFGTETIDITINSTTLPFNVDTGNGRRKFVANPKYFKKVIRKSDAVEYGFPKSYKDFYIIPEKLKIEGIDFSGQKVSLENEVGNTQLIGNKFFENFVVTMDWANHKLFLDPIGKIPNDSEFDFPLYLNANFETNKIEVKTGIREFLKKNKIEKGTTVMMINDIDVSKLTDAEFCEFWNSQWNEIKKNEEVKLKISNKGKEKNIVITKHKITA